MDAKTVHITEDDNVVVAIEPIAKGMTVSVDGRTMAATEDIPQGHKMAISDIKEGGQVIKYGYSIGHATADISAGQWVHEHNMRTNLKGEVDYIYHPSHPVLASRKPDTFLGYVRKDGKVGVRNEIWIIPTVGCVNDVAKNLVRECQDLVEGSIDGLYTFTHPFGCSQTGADHAQTRKLLAQLVRHPNAGAVLVLSLGCENLTHEQFLEELGDFDEDRVKFLTCQKVEDETCAGKALLKISKTPAARWGEPEDLMGPAVFLASEASDFVNGHILYVDGGILAYIGKQP